MANLIVVAPRDKRGDENCPEARYFPPSQNEQAEALLAARPELSISDRGIGRLDEESYLRALYETAKATAEATLAAGEATIVLCPDNTHGFKRRTGGAKRGRKPGTPNKKKKANGAAEVGGTVLTDSTPSAAPAQPASDTTSA